MSTEITDEGQKRIARHLHDRAKTRRITKVLKETETSFDVTDEDGQTEAYVVRGGQTLWIDNATNSTFYVTLEDQRIQLTFIVMGESILLAKKRLKYGERAVVGRRFTRPVSLSTR